MTPKQFKHIRENILKLTSQELANVLGVDLTAVQRWESDSSKKSSRQVNPIAGRAMAYFGKIGRVPKAWPMEAQDD